MGRVYYFSHGAEIKDGKLVVYRWIITLSQESNWCLVQAAILTAATLRAIESSRAIVHRARVVVPIWMAIRMRVKFKLVFVLPIRISTALTDYWTVVWDQLFPCNMGTFAFCQWCTSRVCKIHGKHDDRTAYTCLRWHPILFRWPTVRCRTQRTRSALDYDAAYLVVYSTEKWERERKSMTNRSQSPNARRFTHTNICCHFVGTYFRYIASQYTKIEAVENTHEPNVHPDVRLLIEY